MKKYDYREQLPSGKPVFLVVGRECPDCGSRLVILPPDRIWCASNKCRYSEMHIIGDGVANIESEELIDKAVIEWIVEPNDSRGRFDYDLYKKTITPLEVDINSVLTCVPLSECAAYVQLMEAINVTFK